MTASRIDMRIDESVKAAAEKAAALLGMRSLTEYVVRLIEADANRVIREHSSLVLQNNVFDRFMDACEAPPPPNAKLREALEHSKKLGSR